MQKPEQAVHLGIRNAIEDGLRLLPRRDKAIFPQTGEMLRERRLAEPHASRKLARRKLRRFAEMTEDEQASLVRQSPESGRGLGRFDRELGKMLVLAIHLSAPQAAQWP